MRCECPECLEHEGPDPKIIGIRFIILAAQFLVAMVGLIHERSWKALLAELGALAFFLTLPRYLICCRCEGYGQRCYSLYLGKLTSLYLPKVEGKEVSPAGAALELLTLSVLGNSPAIGLRKNKKLLALYLLLANLTVGFQFWHSCRHCAKYATDWRKDCPSAKLAGSVFNA
jgi:hypothetical protein